VGEFVPSFLFIFLGPLALHIPNSPSLRPVPRVIGLIAGLLVFAARWSMVRVLGTCAALGLLAGAIGLPVS